MNVLKDRRAGLFCTRAIKNDFLPSYSGNKGQEMSAKLREKDKAVRGTAQRCRTRQARSLRIIRREIRDLRTIITDMNFNLQLARKSVRTEGTLIEVLVANSHGQLEKTRRLNPAFKIQFLAVTALRSLNRQMEFLYEEREAAEAKQRKADELSEFSI
jgi:riboflavin biosynthesis pyrimidine reductase